MNVSSINSYSPSMPASFESDAAIQRRQVTQAVNSINDSGTLGRNELVFFVDNQTHRPVVQVQNRETHEVVLQIPPEYVLRLAEGVRTGQLQPSAPLADT